MGRVFILIDNERFEYHSFLIIYIYFFFFFGGGGGNVRLSHFNFGHNFLPL